MKKTFDLRILIIIILLVILCIMIKIYLNNQDNSQSENINFSETQDINTQQDDSSSSQILQTTSQIISGLSENIELHATYYLSESYVENNQEIKKGEQILKYTNGTYLVAPYDCIITQINIPSENEKCTNQHYISISSTNILAMEINVDESIINNIQIGQSAKIEIVALEEELEGYITKTGSTASNGRFTVVVEFENTGNIKIGMSASVEI